MRADGDDVYDDDEADAAEPRRDRGSAVMWAGLGAFLVAVAVVGGGLGWVLAHRQPPGPAQAQAAAAPPAADAGPPPAPLVVPPAAPKRTARRVAVGDFHDLFREFLDNPAAAAARYQGYELEGTFFVDEIKAENGRYGVFTELANQRNRFGSVTLHNRHNYVMVWFDDPKLMAAAEKDRKVKLVAQLGRFERTPDVFGGPPTNALLLSGVWLGD